MRGLLSVLVMLAAVWALPAQAQMQPVARLEIVSRAPAFDGASFGDRGPYELITAIAHMHIDPRARENRGIVDLQYAPRNAQGLVEYNIDVVMLRPRDAAHARRVLVYEVVNRGMRLGAGTFNNAGYGDGAGDGFLMRQGYTLVWSGWQGDITQAGMVGARFPVATRGSRPITGPVTTETIFDDTTSARITLPYPAAALSQAGAELTARQYPGDAPQVIAPAQWRFDDATHVTLTRPANMDAGAIYRFAYTARDPRVMGLGFAATRDLIAFLRHTQSEANPLADLAAAPCERDASGACPPDMGVFNTAVAYGMSQSGRYLRDWLWQGFNRDLAGRRVFDGVLPIIAGGRRTFTNVRFSEPGRFSRQHEDHGVPGFDFPFAYATLRDPVTGRTDGLLRRCTADNTCPRIFHIDTGAEFWQAGASLVGTGGGNGDVALPENVRAYMIASGAHAPGRTAESCALPANALNYTPITRAMLVNMVDWTTARAEPPQSRWPSMAALRPLDSIGAPDLSSRGVQWPRVVNAPESPRRGRTWPVFVPAVDADGNDVAGVRMPDLEAPLGTYLGWNVRRAGYAAGDLCLVYGGYAPFAADAATRGADPRLSIAERYAQTSRRSQLSSAIDALRCDRLLIEEDAARLMNEPRPQ